MNRFPSHKPKKHPNIRAIFRKEKSDKIFLLLGLHFVKNVVK